MFYLKNIHLWAKSWIRVERETAQTDLDKKLLQPQMWYIQNNYFNSYFDWQV